jgi:hypothetical protein
MKTGLFMPVIAVALFSAACGDNPIDSPPKASVRFFNATTGMTGSGGFTANGQFASGSALTLGQAMQSCAEVTAGSTSFGFGTANSAGTGLSGNALATLNNQTVIVGGNYSVVATGSSTSPTLFLLDNTFSGSLGANQAAVRFVNLAPGTSASPNNFVVFIGTLGAGGTLTATDIAVGSPTAFSTVTSGSNAFTILNGHDIVVSGGAATLNLQAGSVNTLAIVPNATSSGFQLINLPRCS